VNAAMNLRVPQDAGSDCTTGSSLLSTGELHRVSEGRTNGVGPRRKLRLEHFLVTIGTPTGLLSSDKVRNTIYQHFA
jgi:hypothetical protein